MVFCFNPCFLGWTSLSARVLAYLRKENTSFNPCFLGWTSLSFSRFCGNLSYHSFQSLFSWMDFSFPFRSILHLQSTRFNPCFLGWTSLSYDWTDPMYQLHERVSILVFLDGLLFPDEKISTDSCKNLFQSLFSWMDFSFSRPRWKHRNVSHAFQSLFSWMDFSFPAQRRIRRAGRTKFQSLFSWMDFSFSIDATNPMNGNPFVVSILVFLDGLLFLMRTIRRSQRQKDCFNPCFLGWTSLSCIRIINCFGINEFQSLFSWMDFSFVCKKLPLPCVQGRFNPCFLGWTSLSGYCSYAGSPVSLFQSLFSWMDFSFRFVKRNKRFRKFMFQSLFSWMDFSFIESIRFKGLLFRSVSILVFLDGLLFLPATTKIVSYHKNVSILVFLDGLLFLMGARGGVDIPEKDCFNPCFLGWTSLSYIGLNEQT